MRKHEVQITFYTANEQYKNRVTDKECLGKVADLTFPQLVYNFRLPRKVNINMAELNRLGDSQVEEEKFKFMTYKDNGFFIAGQVNVASKSRKAEQVLNRTAITLDIDKPKEDMWAAFKLKFKGIQGLMYTTIRHTAAKPRYRIIVPLSEPVKEDAFMKLSQYVAGVLGYENFDTTTHEYARVMFLPAVVNDGEYKIEAQDGEPFNVIEFLPMAEMLSQNTATETKKSEHKDPREMDGWIGMFNRAFTITEAIEKFIPDIYLKGASFDVNNPRYKYFKSAGLPGARVYNDDTLLYSAHDNDPANGKQLHAFNLVKIHLYNNNFDEMLAMVKELPELAQQSPFGVVKEDKNAWVSDLLLTKNKQIIESPYNVQLIFRNDDHLRGLFKLNELTKMIEVSKDLSTIGGATGREGQNLEDADLTDLRIYLEVCATPVRISKQTAADVVASTARGERYNPVKDYLNSLVNSWDGVPRVETMFIDYVKAADTPIIRRMAKKIMAAAIWRVMKPGIKWEGVPVIYGAQNSGKSTFVQKLYKSSPYDEDVKNWVNNTMIEFSNVDKAIERTKAFWGIELAELASLTLSSYTNEQMKAFISADRPTTRVPYDKYPMTFDRQVIFWGTTNTWLYISDQTGGRRFLPVDSLIQTEEEKYEARIKINAMPVDQLWAEAMAYYKDEPLFFTVEEETELNKLRAVHTEESSYQALLSQFVAAKVPEDWNEKTPLERRDYFQNGGNPKLDIYDKEYITMSEIAYEALGRPLSEIQRKNMRDIEVVMQNLGWAVAPVTIKTLYGQSKTFINMKKGGNYNDVNKD